MQERVRTTFCAEEGLPTWATVHYCMTILLATSTRTEPT
jgi:hypothetical protein